MIRKQAFIFVLLMVSLCLGGCSRQKEEKVEITFIHGWGSTEADHVAMRKIYEDFEKEHPEIKLNIISMPSAIDVLSKVGDLLTVGEIPDIIFTAGDGRESIYEFMVEKGYALDLMPVLEKDEGLKNSISPSSLKYWVTQENQLFTVSDVLMLSGGYWYNKDLFREVGIEEPSLETEQWLADCEKIYEYSIKDEQDFKPLILDSDHVVYLTDAILADEIPDLLDNIENKEINLYSQGFRRTLVQLERLAKVSDIVNSFNFRDTLASFNAKETVMYVNGVWASAMIDKNLNVGYMPFPTEDGKGVAAISSGVGYILGDTKDEKQINASIEFLKYMLSEPVANRILQETGQIPSNPNVKITEEAAGTRLYQAIQSIEKAEKIIEVPANIWGTLKKDEYGNNIILYLDKKLSYKELQKKMTK